MKRFILINRFQGLFVISVVALALLVALPATAARNSDQGRNNADSNMTDWVWVGYDWNDDGVIDYGEYIFTYDLKEAQQKSRMRAQQQDDRQMSGDANQNRSDRRSRADRMMQERQGSQRSDRYGAAHMGRPDGDRQARSAQGRSSQSQGEMKTIAGNIRDLKKVDMVGTDRQQVIARVKTRDGRTARVYLGAADNLKKLDLQKGDRIAIQGRRGKIDGRGVLVADRIRTGGMEMKVQPTSDRNLQRFEGEVLKVKTGIFEKHQSPAQVFARVKFDDGATTAVLLGPQDELKNVNLNKLEGSKITLLAHEADIGNRKALIADQIRVNDKTIPIDWSSSDASASRSEKSGKTEGGQQQRQPQGQSDSQQ